MAKIYSRNVAQQQLSGFNFDQSAFYVNKEPNVLAMRPSGFLETDEDSGGDIFAYMGMGQLSSECAVKHLNLRTKSDLRKGVKKPYVGLLPRRLLSRGRPRYRNIEGKEKGYKSNST